MEELAKKLLAAHTDLAGINDEIVTSTFGRSETVRSLENRFLSLDGLGSAGFEAEGFMEGYTKKNEERDKAIEEIKAIRIQAGQDKQEELISELSKLPNSERAILYLKKVPFPNLEAEVTIKREGVIVEPKEVPEEKKGWKFWR